MALNIKANLKKGFGKNEMLSDLKGLAAVPLYVGLPSILKQNSWIGLLIGVGVPYVLGKMLGWYEMSKTALAIGATHLAYLYLDDTIKSINTTGIWALDPDGSKGMKDYVYLSNNTYGISGLSNANLTQLPSGENIMYYPGVGVNDYVDPQENSGLFDYVNNVDSAFGGYNSDHFATQY